MDLEILKFSTTQHALENVLMERRCSEAARWAIAALPRHPCCLCFRLHFKFRISQSHDLLSSSRR